MACALHNTPHMQCRHKRASRPTSPQGSRTQSHRGGKSWNSKPTAIAERALHILAADHDWTNVCSELDVFEGSLQRWFGTSPLTRVRSTRTKKSDSMKTNPSLVRSNSSHSPCRIDSRSVSPTSWTPSSLSICYAPSLVRSPRRTNPICCKPKMATATAQKPRVNHRRLRPHQPSRRRDQDRSTSERLSHLRAHVVVCASHAVLR